MKVTRRAFFKTAGAGAIGSVLGAGATEAGASVSGDRYKGAASTTSVCPYCAVGCGLKVWARDGEIIGVEGDPDHPINEGALCAKGAALLQTVNSPRRLKNVLYRSPGSDQWEEKSWEWALPRIAKRIKETRDATFVKEHNGRTVNRTEAIACLGGAALDTEECYLYAKLARSLGVTFLEHQARI